ncbi:MAG: sensor domain-containing diguanylate cyclase [Burkholderiales bacterium]
MYRPSLRHILITVFAVVCTLPVLMLAGWMYYGVQSQTMQEARDKNQLLSQNLATPIYTYLAGARQSLAIFGVLINHSGDAPIMASTASLQGYFDTIVLRTPQGIVRRWPETARYYSARGDTALAAQVLPFLRLKKMAHTGLVRNPYTGTPTVLFIQPVPGGQVIGLLNLKPVVALGRNIHFGKRGHAAITDQYGRIVLHPNSQWIDQMRSIADWPIIQAGLRGGTGVATFYSPFIKQDMVAGYAAVPEFNWVVITPQPLAEFRQRAYATLRTAGWVAAGSLLVALLLATWVAHWIARPISMLARVMKRLPLSGYQADFGELGRIAPRELDLLQHSGMHMAREMRATIALRDNLNQSLKQQVDKATQGLQEANAKLATQAFIDDLTKLNNRRALWQRVSDMECSSPDSYLPVQVLLFDLDNFKGINDTFGHAGGDHVLSQVAAVIENETREGDFVVRYGGDEFLIVMPRCSAAAAERRAEAIRNAILSQPIEIDGQPTVITMSVGIAESESRLSRPSFTELLKAADQAMYVAKQQGRNRIYFVKG